MLYDRQEGHWIEAVEGITGSAPAVEVCVSDLRDRVLDVLELVGAWPVRQAVASVSLRGGRVAGEADEKAATGGDVSNRCVCSSIVCSCWIHGTTQSIWTNL